MYIRIRCTKCRLRFVTVGELLDHVAAHEIDMFADWFRRGGLPTAPHLRIIGTDSPGRLPMEFEVSSGSARHRGRQFRESIREPANLVEVRSNS